MRYYGMIVSYIGVALVILGLSRLAYECSKPQTHAGDHGVDTTQYTDVVLINKSNMDSVKVFLTLQSTESVDGLFGMDSSNFVGGASCVGSFWAKKGVEYHLGDSRPISGAIVTWGVQNQSCDAAQSIGYKHGINNFEFTVNTWWQEGNLLKNNESTDITCVDGLHSVMEMRVTSHGSRDDSKPSPNFGSFWDYGAKDKSNNLYHFSSVTNGFTLEGCVNLPGVYPYGCDWGYKSHQPPTPCGDPKYPVVCSDKWGDINTSQLNRPGQGGRLICSFIGFSDSLQPME